MPGPGSYDTPDTKGFALPEGGRLSRRPPVSRLSDDPFLDEYPVPAPGHYGVPQDPARPRQTQGKFSKDRRVSRYIEDEARRSRQVPGPGAHDVSEALGSMKPFCPEGGRVIAGASRPADYFDAAPKQHVAPGPGQYDLPPGIGAGKGSGKAIFRYESATISETKALMSRMCGDGGNGPGPGSYDLPDPAPISGAPSIKGRQLPHSMPHPYTYNCAPDHAGKYSSVPPLREQKSAAQSFGTGVGGNRRNSSASSTWPAPAVDRVHNARLPNHVGVDDVPDDEAVQWVSGGFAGMRKSRSTGTLSKGERPPMHEAKRFYPAVSRRGGRAHDAFLPEGRRRCDPVCTHDGASAYKRLVRGKWQMKTISEGLRQATDAALMPLDLEKLKHDAVHALANKALERMNLEGVAKGKQELIMNEMMEVLQEQNLAPQARIGEGLSLDSEPSLHEGDEFRFERTTIPPYGCAD